jgi:hypothetical protein
MLRRLKAVDERSEEHSQTELGEYGSGFQAEIRLSDFIDLDTGRWLNREAHQG